MEQAWIESGIEWSQIEDIAKHGCASGAYMPAVTYHEAVATMAKHGEEIVDFLVEHDCIPAIDPTQVTWSGLCVLYLSAAVETWAFYQVNGWTLEEWTGQR